MRLPWRRSCAPHTCALLPQFVKVLEPTEVLPTRANICRLSAPTSPFVERRNTLLKTWKLPRWLYTPYAQSSKRLYQTQMSREFQLLVMTPAWEQRWKLERWMTCSACPALANVPIWIPTRMSRNTRSLSSHSLEKLSPRYRPTAALLRPSKVRRLTLAYQTSRLSMFWPTAPSQARTVVAGSSPM